MTDRPENEREPVWAVDAEVGGDGAVALPRPGGIAFPWRAPRERPPPTPEEIEQRRLRSERWGPPRPDLDRRMLVITLSVLACDRSRSRSSSSASRSRPTATC